MSDSSEDLESERLKATQRRFEHQAYIEAITRFLQDGRPGAEMSVPQLWEDTTPPSSAAMRRGARFTLRAPTLQLFCSDSRCQGERVFALASERPEASELEFTDFVLQYRCRNCSATTKHFYVRGRRSASPKASADAKRYADGELVMVGEWPQRDLRLPRHLANLFGGDLELFATGRRAEHLRMGVGAFAYYRRVLANRWDELVGEIRKAAEEAGASSDVLQGLEDAKGWKFSGAVTSIKPALPESLMIEGQNPLLLLHRVLSGGLHKDSDEECLTLAHSVRSVLTELGSRVEAIRRDKSAIRTAVSNLQKKVSEKTPVNITADGGGPPKVTTGNAGAGEPE